MISAMKQWFEAPTIIITPPRNLQPKNNPADDYMMGWVAKKTDRVKEEVKKTGWNKL